MFNLVLAMNQDGSPSASIVFIPEGKNVITPSVNGKAKTITVNLNDNNGESIAAKFNQDLQKRLSGGVRPIFDFDHKETGPASAIPKSFRYEKGKGIVAEIEWTGAGKDAIEAKNYSYFSPCFKLGENGEPVGLPEFGALGALVNDPAFRTIPRIAASNLEPTSNQKNTMNELVICGLLNESESAKENAAQIARARVADLKAMSEKYDEKVKAYSDMEMERDDLKKRLAEVEAELMKQKEAEADKEISAAVAAGRIAAKDEETKTFYRQLIIEKGAVAVKALNAMPSASANVTDQIVTAGQSQKNDSGFEAKAEELVKAGKAQDLAEAYDTVMASHPELYNDFLNGISSK